MGCPRAHSAMQQAVADRLKKNNKYGSFTMEEVQKHNRKDSAWIAVEGKVRLSHFAAVAVADS